MICLPSVRAGHLAFATTLCLLASLPVAVFAQPSPDQPSVADQPDKRDDVPVLREQTVYVPYSKLRESFEKEGRGVFLPYEQFQALWKAARAAETKVPDSRPPVGALITEITSDATIAEDVISVEAKLTVELLTDGWHRVPLRLGDAAIGAARLGGKPARLVAVPQGGYQLLVQRTADDEQQLELELEYTKAYTKAPGQNSVSLQAPQAPVNRWKIRIPEPGVKVNVHPMIAAAEVPDEAGEGDEAKATVVMAFLGAVPTVRIDWTPKAEGALGLAALATVQAEQQVTLDQGVVRTRTQLRYEITRADLSQLIIEVPADHKVAGIFDPNVRQWDVKTEGEQQQITIQLFQPTRGQQDITVDLEKFSGEFDKQQFAVPVVKALGVNRQQGIVVVRLGEGLRAENVSRSGLLQLDAAELPSSLGASGWSFAYRYAALPFDLKLDVEKIEPRIVADQLVEAYLEPEKLTLDLLVLYDIQKAGVFQFRIDIPKGFEVRQVTGRAGPNATPVVVDAYNLPGADGGADDGGAGQEQPDDGGEKQPDDDAAADDAADDDDAADAAADDAEPGAEDEPDGENDAGGTTTLTVNLARKAIGKVGLFVELERRLDDPNLLSPTGNDTEMKLPLPRVTPDSVDRSTGRLVICKPESLRVNPSEQKGLRSISFSEAYREIPTCRDARFPKTQPSLAFAFTDQAVALTVEAERRKPHITVRQFLAVEIKSGQVKYIARLSYNIRYSGVDSLRLDIPADLVDKINNITPAIRESRIQPQPADVAEGYVALELAGETELLGDVPVGLEWEQNMSDLEVGKPIAIAVPALRPADVDLAWGQIVVAKTETIDVRAGEHKGLRPIDPQYDIPEQDRLEGAARAFEFHDDWTLALAATRYKLEEVKQTSIEMGVVRQVVTRSGRIAVQALYRMRSARQRLVLSLPSKQASGLEFDAQPVRINGRTVPLESGSQDELYVPLVGQDPDRPFLLELRYTMKGAASELQVPDFPGEPAVQQVYICAYVPDEQALLGSTGPWTSEQLPWWQTFAHSLYRHGVTVDQLVQQVAEGTPAAGNPAATFPVDGKLYIFSTLKPPAGATARCPS